MTPSLETKSSCIFRYDFYDPKYNKTESEPFYGLRNNTQLLTVGTVGTANISVFARAINYTKDPDFNFRGDEWAILATIDYLKEKRDFGFLSSDSGVEYKLVVNKPSDTTSLKFIRICMFT